MESDFASRDSYTDSRALNARRAEESKSGTKTTSYTVQYIEVTNQDSRGTCPSTLLTLLPATTMSSKRKWDEPAEDSSDSPTKVAKTDEGGKTASDAAAAAAAIAAKIAAQYAAGGIGSGSKDPHDGDFTYDIDINDVRNRYMLTKGGTQQQAGSVAREECVTQS
jgi:hypothetical protein